MGDGDVGDFGGFAVAAEALIERPEVLVVAGGDDRGLIEGAADGCASVGDVPGAAPMAGVGVEGSQTGELGDLPAVALAEFGQPGEEGPGDAFPDAADQAEGLHPQEQRLGHRVAKRA